jgi:hypothetical protein
MPAKSPIPPSGEAKSVLEAVRALRTRLGQTQQVFAERTLNIAMSTAIRYELSRPPRGPMLYKLIQLAEEKGFEEQAEVFRTALNREFGVVAGGSGSKLPETPVVKLNPRHLYTREELQEAYDRHVAAIMHIEGRTIDAIRLEFDSSDGRKLVADIAAPSSPPPGLKVLKRRPAITAGRR